MLSCCHPFLRGIYTLLGACMRIYRLEGTATPENETVGTLHQVLRRRGFPTVTEVAVLRSRDMIAITLLEDPAGTTIIMRATDQVANIATILLTGIRAIGGSNHQLYKIIRHLIHLLANAQDHNQGKNMLGARLHRITTTTLDHLVPSWIHAIAVCFLHSVLSPRVHYAREDAKGKQCGKRQLRLEKTSLH